MRRHDCRFLWHNRGYRTFDDFLATFRADKRKKAKRERRKVAESGVAFRSLAGEDIDAGLWHTIFGFSERTFLRHGNGHYLNVEFLLRVSAALPGAVVVKVAERAGTPVAAAIFFAGGGWLYGRYWGSAVQEDSLHFEACYYQGIEHCIEHGLQFFDPGTQGEHKLARGFEPTRTTSAHWLEHAGFRNAVARYLERERAAVDDYIEAARQHLPFQRTTAATPEPMSAATATGDAPAAP
jgi:predicted N-acyltransferase